jgi:sortase A
VVLDGTDAWTLNRAVGHIRGTSYPGTAGNVGIAGHRDGYFKALREVHPQDEILLTSPDGSVQRYFVDHARIVQPDDVSVLADGKRPSITLVTCYPFSYVGAAPKRYILTASRAPAPNEAREGPSS